MRNRPVINLVINLAINLVINLAINLVISLAVLLCFWPALCSAQQTNHSTANNLYHESRPAMGTTFDFYLYAASPARAAELFEVAFDEVERTEALLSNYRPTSELSRINRHAATAEVITDREVFALVNRSLEWSRKSDGAFDITVGRLMKAWGFFRGAGRFPDKAELALARSQTGWQRVRLDAARRAIRFTASGIELDPGGIGKGYALDLIAKLWREQGVTSALLEAGSSSVYALGAPPGKQGWPVRVTNPLNREQVISTITLRNESLATSGSYEKFFRLQGRTYCHIMDPRTGRPVEGVLQTTVIAPEATDSEALSKVTFVLDTAESRKIIQATGGAQALLITFPEGAMTTLHVTPINWLGVDDKARPLKGGTLFDARSHGQPHSKM